jgi:hypothetical protein
MNDITAASVTSSRIEALGGLLVIDAQGASGFLCQRRTRSGKDHSKGDWQAPWQVQVQVQHRACNRMDPSQAMTKRANGRKDGVRLPR